MKSWRRSAEDAMFSRMARRDALDATHWLIDRVKKVAGHRWRQGLRVLRIPSESYDPDVALVASERLWHVGELEARALVGWVEGRREADLMRALIPTREVVRLQAAGRRCVALVDDVVDRQGLELCLHDLRHLEKLF